MSLASGLATALRGRGYKVEEVRAYTTTMKWLDPYFQPWVFVDVHLADGRRATVRLSDEPKPKLKGELRAPTLGYKKRRITMPFSADDAKMLRQDQWPPALVERITNWIDFAAKPEGRWCCPICGKASCTPKHANRRDDDV
jgi:hypothetical protein